MDLLPLWLVLVGMGCFLLVLACKLHLLLRWQRLLAELAIALIIVSLPFVILLGLPLIATGFMIVLCAWLALVAARLIFGRLDIMFLHSSTVFNVLIIAGLMLITLLWVSFLPSLTLHF